MTQQSPVPTWLQTLRAERATLLQEAETLTRDGGDLEGEQADRFDAIERALATNATQLDDAEARSTRMAEISGMLERGELKIEHGSDVGPDFVPQSFRGDPWSSSERMEISDRARRCLDAVARDAVVPGVERACERVERAFTGLDGEIDGDEMSRWVATTSDPNYMRAIVKLFRDPQLGHTEFNKDELAAYQRSKHLQRAMSTSAAAGGYLIPFALDPSILLTSDGSLNQVRQAARTVVTTSDRWHGVSSAGVVASWDAEASEVSDDSPTLSQPTITTHRLTGFVPISLEAAMDEVNVAEEVAKLIMASFDELEGRAFVVGAGDASNQPVGVLTALSGVTASTVNTTTADTFSLVDIYKLDGSLPARYRQRASWLANRAIYNLSRQFDTSGGAALWTQLQADVPGQLLGSTTLESEVMAASPVGTNAKFMVLGSFSDAYTVVDRIGSTIEFIPHLFGASGRPTGQRGWFAFKRVGADVVNAGALRQLNGQ